jgi:hypothetical protein
MLWMVTLHPEWTRRRALMAVYFLGLLAFIAVLVTRNPWFGLFAVTGYLHAWEVLAGRWRLAGVTAAAVLHVTAIFGGRPPSDLAGGLAFVVLVVVIVATTAVFAGLSDTVSDQNQQRKRMIAELAEANHKLEAAMAENEGLHAQLLTQAREAGVLDERQRMAREIHDTLAQGLTGIITGPGGAGRRRPAGRLAPPPGERGAAGAGEPVGGPPLGPGGGPGAADGRAPARGARRGGGPLVRPARRGGRGRHHGDAPGLCTRRSRWRCCAPPRRRWPTWPSTPAPPGWC